MKVRHRHKSQTLISVKIMSRKTGKVKFFNHSKGYGFISSAGSDTDIFVHVSALERSGIDQDDFKEGVEVSFDTITKEGKTKAADINLI